MFARVTEVVYSTADVWQTFPTIAIIAGLLGGGIWVFYLLISGLHRILFKREYQRTMLLERADGNQWFWTRIHEQYRPGFIHGFLQLVFYTGAILIAWWAFSMVGVNALTSSATTLGISIILSYGFGSIFMQLFSGTIVMLRGSIAPGQHWEIAGLGTFGEGVVERVDWFDVTLSRFDEEGQTGEMVVVPITHFLSSARKYNARKQEEHKKVTTYPERVRPL